MRILSCPSSPLGSSIGSESSKIGALDILDNILGGVLLRDYGRISGMMDLSGVNPLASLGGFMT